MELSSSDKIYIDNQSRENKVHQYLDNIVPFNFKVGDYLVRKIRDFNKHGKPIGDWRLVKISPFSNTNKKFLVVHIDNHGVPYIKHVRVNGKLSGIVCMASITFEISRFEPDPDYADHILLHGEDVPFDPLGVYKESKR